MTVETMPARPRPLRGVLLVMLATLAFAAADTITKDQAMRHPVNVVMAIRYLVNLALLTVFLGPRVGAGLWRTQRSGLVFARALSLAVASLSMAMALRLMPVGEAAAISYIAPVAVMLLAIPLLGERVGPAGWAGAALGFLGVLLIAQPGGGLDPLGVVFALINAAVSCAYFLLTRVLTRTETTIAMLYHTALVGSVVFCALAIFSLDGLAMTLADVGMIAVLGALMTAGHFLFTSAYREAPASMLAPVNYLHLFWAGGLSWLVFGHVPDLLSIGGMIMVGVSGIVVTLSAWWTRARMPPPEPQ